MKTFLLAVSLSAFLLPAGGRCDDCAGAKDACKPPAEQLTPFMARLKEAAGAAPAPGPEKKAAPAAEKKPAAFGAPAAQGPESPEPAPAAAPEEKSGTISRPGWLLFSVLSMYGLYYFLKEGKKRKGGK